MVLIDLAEDEEIFKAVEKMRKKYSLRDESPKSRQKKYLYF